MRYLAFERELPAVPRPDHADLLRREAAAVWQLQAAGIVREISFTHPERHAVVMLECASLASARQHLATLPLVRAGLIEFQIHELRPYDGYERLFAAGPDGADPSAAAPAEY